MAVKVATARRMTTMNKAALSAITAGRSSVLGG